jgi:hypothetical protein
MMTAANHNREMKTFDVDQFNKEGGSFTAHEDLHERVEGVRCCRSIGNLGTMEGPATGGLLR